MILPAAVVAAIGFSLCVARGAGPPTAFTLDESIVDDDGRLTSESREGHVSLSWSAGDGDWVYELQSASSAAFTDAIVRCEGADSTSFISGLEDGEHFFRVRARPASSSASEQAWGPWSRPVIVPVRHQSLTTAWSLFAAGGVLFSLIVVFLVVNARRANDIEVTDG